VKAVAYQRSLPIEHDEALLDVELPDPPAPTGHDLLVAVRAVSVNPVDTKVRRRDAPAHGDWTVLGWDAAGEVLAVGEAVARFKPGDRVYYAGALQRPGSNAERQTVDARLVGPMPASLDFADAAALPLTALTAWELLFERLGIAPTVGQTGTLLAIGAAGGVGSILVQLLRALTGVTVVATAGRPASAEWLGQLGAHHVLDHTASATLAQQLRALNVPDVDWVASLTHTDQHLSAAVDCLRPFGRFGLIDDPGALDIGLLKRKSLSLHWEFMYTRSLFATPDQAEQGRILERVAALVDAGAVRSTAAMHFGAINAANLRRAHALLERGEARGKVVLSGFD